MAKYLFVYHGGKHPETDEEMAEVMDAWGQWMGGLQEQGKLKGGLPFNPEVAAVINP